MYNICIRFILWCVHTHKSPLLKQKVAVRECYLPSAIIKQYTCNYPDAGWNDEWQLHKRAPDPTRPAPPRLHTGDVISAAVRFHHRSTSRRLPYSPSPMDLPDNSRAATAVIVTSSRAARADWDDRSINRRRISPLETSAWRWRNSCGSTTARLPVAVRWSLPLAPPVGENTYCVLTLHN